MPSFRAVLTEFRTVNDTWNQQVGEIYSAYFTPESKLCGPAYQIFFYPKDDLEDKKTYMGVAAARLCGVSSKSSGDMIQVGFQSINASDKKQLNLEIPVDSIIISQDLDPYHVKVHPAVVEDDKLTITNFPHPRLYSRKPANLRLVCQAFHQGLPDQCYSCPSPRPVTV